MELSSFNIKKLLTFSHISGNGIPPKISYSFSKESFSYISRNGNLEKVFTFQERKLSYISRNGNPEKLLIFRK